MALTPNCQYNFQGYIRKGCKYGALGKLRKETTQLLQQSQRQPKAMQCQGLMGSNSHRSPRLSLPFLWTEFSQINPFISIAPWWTVKVLSYIFSVKAIGIDFPPPPISVFVLSTIFIYKVQSSNVLPQQYICCQRACCYYGHHSFSVINNTVMYWNCYLQNGDKPVMRSTDSTVLVRFIRTFSRKASLYMLVHRALKQSRAARYICFLGLERPFLSC